LDQSGGGLSDFLGEGAGDGGACIRGRVFLRGPEGEGGMGDVLEE